MSHRLHDKLQSLPDAPGVYLMKDRRGSVVYVGKAKSLRGRVRSYFGRGPDDRPLLPFLRAEIHDFDILQVSTEKEAFLLEDSLIKQHKPRYNVRLVDDKTYLSLRLDRRHPFPRFVMVRRPRPDGARHFGPFASARSVRETLKTIYRTFGIRSCTDSVFANRSRPCLYHQIGQCLAPCVGYVSRDEYSGALAQAELLLAGRDRELLGRLEEEMLAAATEERFEEAARLRDRLQAIERTVEKQQVAGTADADFDAWGHAPAPLGHLFVLLVVREGRIVDSSTIKVRDRTGLAPEQVLPTVLLRSYERREPPGEIVVPVEPADQVPLREVLAERRGRPVELVRPQRGRRRRLLDLARTSAQAAAGLERAPGEDRLGLLDSLRELLALPRAPLRIECFDISNLGGTLTVGAMSVAIDGEPAPEEYRHYRVRLAPGGDDYASLREVLRRRLERARKEGSVPDLLLVDGGRGQLAAAMEAAQEQGLGGLPLVAISKGPERDAGRELLHTLEHDLPIRLPPHDARLHLLQRIRDEAHRFAIAYNRRLRRIRDRSSELDEIPGIGPARRRALLRQFGSLARLRQASIEQISAAARVGSQLAAAIHAHLAASGGAAGSDPKIPAGRARPARSARGKAGT